ncbi:hypothetical protein LCGC14_0504550 [marine sediment metagenome]|uniref:Uncharacterized protein n=1 Tax=marine sediment metagenome TaxID=412755 RepID=A0A0F9S2Y1_9ZZZZ
MVHKDRSRNTDTLERRRQESRDWYAKNKGEYNAARRRRYWTDAVYAAAAIERSRMYRKNQVHESRDWVIRKKDGQLVQCWRIGAVAKRLDRSVDTIRRWQALRLIPRCNVGTHGRGHRLFLGHQIHLIEKLSVVMPWNRKKHDGERVSEVVVNIRRLW